MNYLTNTSTRDEDSMSEKAQEIDGHYDGYEEPKNDKDVIPMDGILPNWLMNGMDEKYCSKN